MAYANTAGEGWKFGIVYPALPDCPWKDVSR
jgi:hypothetical protein